MKCQKSKIFEHLRNLGFRRQKKSQVTIFIILGIILLIIVGSYIVIESEGVKVIESEQAVVEEVPVMFEPVQQFVEYCIIREGENALTKIGNSGGYVDLYEHGINANPNEPTESSAFMVFPNNKDSSVAYWYYFKSNNRCRENCVCGSEKPNLYKTQGEPSIEGQLEKYIDNNLRNCLDNFKAFEEQGFNINEVGTVKSDVSIRDSVVIEVKYPLEIKKQRSKERIDRFYVTIPLDLRKIYELAEGITNAEQKFMYLDRWTIEELTAFGLGMNKDKLPPISASTLEPGKAPVIWTKTDVKKKVQNNILPHYTSFFQVYNTANYNARADFYGRATLPIVSPSGDTYEDLNVNFEYLNYWPIYFDISGRGVSGDVIGPESAIVSYFDWVGIRRYDFYYDISYPVKVDIYDKDALNKKGYHFIFGLEANVRDNKALNCSSRDKELVAPPTTSLLCQENQRCAKVLIETLDAQYNNRLEDVNVIYSSTSESCDIGVVEQGLNEISLPQCVGSGCSLLVSKQGYWSYPQTYSVRCYTTSGCEREDVLCDNEKIIVDLEPYRTKDFVVKKKRMMKDTSWKFNNEAVNLLDNEYVVLSLEKIKENQNEEDFAVNGIFNGDEFEAVLERIIPGKYKARMDLFYKFPDLAGRKEVVFKGKEECAGGIAGIGEKCVTIDDMKFNETFNEGGAVFEFEITKDKLDNNDVIEFYVISTVDSSSFNLLSIDDTDQMGKVEELSETYRSELEPKFKK